MISPIPTHQIFLFLLQFAMLLATARLLGELMKRYDQPPVFGELLAGILLGPSLLGWIAPSLFTFLFPPDPQQYHLIELISWLGMIFLLLFTGLELDLAVLRSLGRPAIFASLFGIALPFASGYALGSFIPDHLVANPSQRLVFHLFMGTAMAISAVPVIAKILLDMGLLKRNIGTIIMGAAIVDDISGWTILSMLLGLATKGVLDLPAVTVSVLSTALFIAFSLLVGVHLVRRLMRWVNDRVQIEEAHITAVLVLTLLCAAITEGIGIHAVFGAFVAGVILSQAPRVRANALEKLAGVVYGVFTPVFFSFVGLRVDLLRLHDFSLVGAVIGVACAGKLIGCTAGGLLGRLSWWESLTIGIGMNARGGMELIVALIGLTAGILSPELYGSLVIMAMVTSLMAPPLLKWALSHVTISEEEQQRLELANHHSIFDKRTLRILIPTAGGPNALTALRIAAPLATSADATITALFVSNNISFHPVRFFSRLWKREHPQLHEPTQLLFQLGREYGVNIDAKIVQAVEERAPEVILREARRGYDLVLLGASGYRHPLGGAYIKEMLAAAPTHLAIIKARGEQLQYKHLLVPTNGEGDTQLAIEFAAMYAEDAGARMTLFHTIPPPEHPRRLFRRSYTPLDENTLKMMADTLVWELRPRRAKSELQIDARVAEEERPTPALLREVQRGSYDLLIVSAPLRTIRPPYLLDPATEQIVNEAPCTVIVITPQRFRPGFPH
jgi:Kef-type K+ transport system membrane component KefB/nucleotide-binding universal stress UspA family protein